MKRSSLAGQVVQLVEDLGFALQHLVQLGIELGYLAVQVIVLAVELVDTGVDDAFLGLVLLPFRLRVMEIALLLDAHDIVLHLLFGLVRFPLHALHLTLQFGEGGIEL
ncbi:MAG: hypothetical protein WDN27_00855 [Candidatus Saccharibacteria bacterium]